MNDPAAAPVALLHGTTRAVTYPSRAEPSLQLTGLVHLPHGEPPADGWPVVSYAHMTTGAGDRSAPSTIGPDHPERVRASRGDGLCDLLLERGVAVLRPDYPGLGSPGPHPYLVGEPLARSVVDMVAARHSFDPRIGDRWVAAGHSEGATATLFTTVRDDWPVPLRAAVVFAPVTRMDVTIGFSSRLPFVVPGTAVVSALIALMLAGAATVSEDVASRLHARSRGGGLSDRAAALWDHLEARSLNELALPDSFGGLAPTQIADRRLYRALFAMMREHDVAHLRPAVPLRVDSALRDEVAPWFLTRRAVRRWRESGEVVHREWRSNHPDVVLPEHAGREAADWIVERLGPGERDG